MKIGIDISQLAYPNTGVANYLLGLVRELVKNDKHEFILFFSSLRRGLTSGLEEEFTRNNVTIKKFKLPPSALDFLWNSAHIAPIETFIGKVDLFITSDWTEPPARAKKATIIYDMIVFKYPEETAGKIVATQKRKLEWVKKESDIILAISKSTKDDIESTLGISSDKIKVVYPGFTL